MVDAGINLVVIIFYVETPNADIFKSLNDFNLGVSVNDIERETYPIDFRSLIWDFGL